jgi:protein TonB
MIKSKGLLLVCLCFITSLCFGNETKEVISDTLKNPKDHPNDIIFIGVDIWPEYIGGQKEMYKFISENINETVAIKKGRVNLRFVIEKDGSIGDVEILRSLCSQCDEEAKRVIKLMPKWKSGQVNYKNARCYYHIPIVFK